MATNTFAPRWNAGRANHVGTEPEQLVQERAYKAAWRQNPKWAADLVRVGAAQEANGQSWTTACVRLLEVADNRIEHGDTWTPRGVAS